MAISRVLSLLLLATVSVQATTKHTIPNRSEHKSRAEHLTKKQGGGFNLIDEAEGQTFFECVYLAHYTPLSSLF